MQTKLLIGGALVEGDGAVIPVVDPATGSQIATVAQASDAQVDAAVASAEEAFDSFSQTTPAARSEMLLAIANTLETHQDELAELESRDVGKPSTLFGSSLGPRAP